jgi:chromosome segregation ATPase
LGGNSAPTEVIKEVEKIVEVEVIKEVPVEKVVTKVEYISDKTNENELVQKIHQLEELMAKKDENLDELRRTLDETPKEVKITEYVEKVVINTENEEILLQRIKKLEELISKKDENLDELRRELDVVLDELESEKSNIKTVEIIKEVLVENTVDNDKNKTYLLQETLQKLRRQLNEKDSEIKRLENIIKELEDSLKIKGAVFMKNSNINDNI